MGFLNWTLGKANKQVNYRHVDKKQKTQKHLWEHNTIKHTLKDVEINPEG